MNKFRIIAAAAFIILSLSACSGEDEVVINEASTEEEVSSTEEASEAPVTATSFVYVTGAVNEPGVYEVPADTRVFQVIDRAGGFTEDAATDSLNLASVVQDGSLIRVMTESEYSSSAVSEIEGLPSGQPDNGLININTASLSELTTINGIGESRAQAIIEYRESNGGFRTIDDIKKVTGIKDGLFNKIKDRITV